MCGYTKAVAKSLVSGFGDHAYGCSQNAVFDVEKLEVKVEYRDNKAQVELEAIEQELGIVDNTGVEETHGTKIVLEMVDARKQMERMRSRAQMGASMTSPGGGPSRITGAEGSIGESTFNLDCFARNEEVQRERKIENAKLKGTLAEKEKETDNLRGQLEGQMEEYKQLQNAMTALLGGSPENITAAKLATLLAQRTDGTRFQENSSAEDQNRAESRKVVINEEELVPSAKQPAQRSEDDPMDMSDSAQDETGEVQVVTPNQQARKRGKSNAGSTQTNEAQQQQNLENNRVPPKSPARKGVTTNKRQQQEEPRTSLQPWRNQSGTDSPIQQPNIAETPGRGDADSVSL